jgi:hypothetical protein
MIAARSRLSAAATISTLQLPLLQREHFGAALQAFLSGGPVTSNSRPGCAIYPGRMG